MPTVYCAAGRPGPDPEANLERIGAWAAAARVAGAGLLLTPELFVTAEPAAGDAVVRERLAWVARRAGIGIVASTPERAGTAAYVGADWWDAAGRLVAHVRKRRLTGWQRRRGFSAWSGRPLIMPGPEYAVGDMSSLAFGDDVADPAHAYFLRDHGVRRLLVLEAATTRQELVAAPPPWAAKHTGVPFPQSGSLPEELLRPLPRVPAAWWTVPVPRTPADLGS